MVLKAKSVKKCRYLSSESFVKRQDRIVLKELEDEGMILNLRNGHYFTLDKLGLFIWKSLDGKKNLEQIAQRIVSRYAVTKTTALADLIVVTKDLYGEKLVTVANKSVRLIGHSVNSIMKA